MQRTLPIVRISPAIARHFITAPVGREPPVPHEAAPSRDRRDTLEVSIPKPRLQPYAHRTFMGLAGSMLQDATWSACLQRCMPQLHARCVAPGVTIQQAMRLLEGNPILAAYGLSRGDDKALPMEWDLWLDPVQPHNLALARVIHGNALSTHLASTKEGEASGADIMAGRIPGTDVHEGLTPLRWMALFQEAAATGGLSATCRAVYLDVKSSWSDAPAVAAFVTALKQHNVETRGVLAFDFKQLAAPLQVPHAVHLTHSPAGLALVLPNIPRGAAAMFNGGALLQERGGHPVLDETQLGLVRKLQSERDLRIGVYLQEDEVSPAALGMLITCINREADTFQGGIAYGGLAGVAEGLVAGTGQGCQAGEIGAENARYFVRGA